MAGPELADLDEEEDIEAPEDEGTEMPDEEGGIGFDSVDDADDGDFDVGTVDLGIGDDEDIVAGFEGFDGTDDATDDGGQNSGQSGGGGGQQAGGPAGGEGPSLAFAINSGMARVSAVGLPDHEKARVESEMYEIADAFYLGYFGEQCINKYLSTDLRNIPPEYGLAASLIAFLAIALYKRPDGSEKVGALVAQFRAKLQQRRAAEPEDDDDEDDE